MSVRVRYSLSASLSSSSSEEKDLGNVKWEILTDKQGEGGIRKVLVPVGAVDVSVPLDTISEVRLIIARTTAKDPNQLPGSITFRINSITGEQRSIVPLDDAKEGHYLLSTSGVNSMFVSNAGTVDMELTLLLVGD